MLSLTRFALGFAVVSAFGTQVASAQAVISAQSGLIHYTEGRVFLNGQLIEPKYGEFPQLKENQQLRTEDGRVEVLLTPGVFLRLGENGTLRMVTNRLISTRLELVSGETLVQVDELLRSNSVTVSYQEYTVQFLKTGIYRMTTEPQQLRVYSGEALVNLNGEAKIVKDGQAFAMDGNPRLAKFDKNDVDELYKWSRLRSEYLAMANVSAAKSVQNAGMSVPGWYPLGSPGMWCWNPYFGMYTFCPFWATFQDPWGFAFWSPYMVDGYLASWPGYYSGGGSGSKPVAHHPPGRTHPTPPPRHGNQPAGVPRGVTLAAAAHRSVSAGSGSHAGGVGGFGGGSAHAGGSGFSGGGSSGGSASSAGHSTGGSSGASGGASGGGGSHK